jgi:hypothetical protein
MEDGTDKLSRNVGKNLTFFVAKIPKEYRSYIHRGGCLKLRITGLSVGI